MTMFKRGEKMKSWREEVIYLLENLGGHAYLKEIYDEFLKSHTRPIIPTYDASIRKTLETGCVQSDVYDGKGEVFFMVEGKNKGHYGLVNYNYKDVDFTQEDYEFSEGKAFLKKHLIRERNQLVITKAKK